MKLVRVFSVITVGLFLPQGTVRAQSPETSRPGQVMGEVVSLDAANRRITIKADNGISTDLIVRPNAPVLRVAPGSKDVKSAERISLSDIGQGDRVAATTHQTPGGIEAGSLVVMAKAAITQEQQREIDQWRRAAGGLVTEVNPAARTFTIQSPQGPLVVKTAPSTDFRRYAKESIRYADAAPSSLDAIHTGDQVRVLGKRNPAEGTVAAERVISGAFRQIAGTIKSVDAGKGEVEITDLATKSPVLVRINADTKLKRLPDQMAAMMALRYRQGGGRGDAPIAGGRSGADREDTGAQPGGRGPEGGRGGAVDINQMLDRLPAAPIADLKPGEAVMLSSMGETPGNVTAVVLLAGVDPLLRASPTATRDLMSGWLSGGGQGGGDGGGDSGPQ
jgi:hypothetical protein